MTRLFGRVKELFIPLESNPSINEIGFKIQVKDEIITVITEQTTENANIYKDDFVFITKTIIDNKTFYDIEPIGDEEYES